MNEYYALIPEILSLFFGLAIFVYGIINRKSSAVYFLGIVALALSAFCLFFINFKSEVSFGLISIDPVSNILRVLIFITGVLILAFSNYEIKSQTDKNAEYVLLVIIAVLGMNIMVISWDLLLFYLGLETFSLSSYILAGFYRNNKKSIEAGMKYFILGTVSSILLLASIAFFYAITGSTSLESFKAIDFSNRTIIIGLFFIISAFAFKLSLVPFHAWAPDVYQGSPTPVAAFFSTAPKVAVFGALLRIFLSGAEKADIANLIVIVSALSMIIGNLLALRQKDLKRMFAYSSIAHAGYIFMAFLLVDQTLLNSLLPYLIVYIFMNIGAFAVIMSVKEGENIENYYGLGKISPLIAFSMTVILFSLTGIPPTAGFIVKFNIFKNVFMAGYGEIVFLGLLMSILSAFYYLRIVLYMYREAPGIKLDSRSLNHYIALISSIFLLLAGIFPSLLPL